MCSVEMDVPADASAITVSKVALPVLVRRCDAILRQYAEDEESKDDLSRTGMRPLLLKLQLFIGRWF